MKKVKYLSLLIIAALLISNCDKVQENETGDKYKPTVITWVKYNQIDSILYTNGSISKIKEYREDQWTDQYDLTTSYRLENSGSQIFIYEKNGEYGSVEELEYKFVFSNNLLSEIRNEENRLYASYIYEGSLLKHFLYYNSEETICDSLVVKYDSQGNNIIELKWFEYNSESSLYSLISTFNYIHDTHNNPYQNLIHHPILYWDEEELSLDYFNLNNITTVGSYNRTYSYNENGYPEYVDLGGDGRVYFEYDLF